MRNVIVILKGQINYEFMEQEKFEPSFEGGPQAKGLSPEQDKLFDKVDASFFLTGASNDQGLSVETSIDEKQIKMILHKETTLSNLSGEEREQVYYTGILWQDDVATKLPGDAAKRLFGFYGPIAALKHPPADVSLGKELPLERSLEDKLLGLE